MHTDQKFIDALRLHDERGIAGIYNIYAPKMKAYLFSKGASGDDAADVFQEALTDIYKLAYDGKFELTCPFEAFLLVLCKRKWINLADKNKVRRVTNIEEGGYTHVAEDSNAASLALQAEKEKLVIEKMKLLSDKCREVISRSLEKKPQEEIADELGVTYAYFRKKKSNCLAELAGLVKKSWTNQM